MNRYFYGLNNERHGPVTEPALEQLLRNGVLTGDTLLWASGMEGWQPLRTVFPQWLVAPEAGSETAVCAVSGRVGQTAEMVRFGHQWVLPQFRDVYVQRRMQHADEPAPENLITAGAWRRIGAFLIDVGLFFLLPIFGLALVAALLGHEAFLEDDSNNTWIAAGLMLVMAAIEAAMMLWKQASFGKWILGMEVVAVTGGQLTGGQAIGRTAAKYFLPNLCGIVFIICLVQFLSDSRLRQVVHDQLSKTRVVLRRRRQP